MGRKMISGKQIHSLLVPRRTPAAAATPTPSAAVSATDRVHHAVASAKTLTRPRWLLFHVVILALTVTFVGLGRWQLDVSDAKHFDFFNFQYAVQWWLFTAFGLFMWIRVMQHRLNPPPADPANGGIVVKADGARVIRQGPAYLLARGTTNGEPPVMYRGYVVPESSSVPVRSHGDELHNAYNDFLWQLAATDGAAPDVHVQGVTPLPVRREVEEGTE